MTILLAFPSFNISFFLIFVLLELDSDLSISKRHLKRSSKIRNTMSNDMNINTLTFFS